MNNSRINGRSLLLRAISVGFVIAATLGMPRFSFAEESNSSNRNSGKHDQIQTLREEVRSLRNDVRRLCELIEKRHTNERHKNAGVRADEVVESPTASQLSQPDGGMSSTGNNQKLIVNTYLVADLVIPLPTFDEPKPDGSPPKASTALWLELIDKITKSIEPHTWDVNGGSSTIEIAAGSFALVVRASSTTHEMLHQLLNQMRKEMEVQICTEIKLWDGLEADFLEKSDLKVEFNARTHSTKLTSAETIQLEQSWKRHVRTVSPDNCGLKLTTFNGQIASLAGYLEAFRGYQDDHQVAFRGTVSDDHQTIRFNYAVLPRNLVSGLTKQVEVMSEGETILVDLNGLLRDQQRGFTPAGQMFVLIRPRVFLP